MPIKNFSPYTTIKETIAILKPNEKKVILGRFGVDCERKTLSTIGKELDLSRERVRQIEREGLKKLAKSIVVDGNTFIKEIVETFEKFGGVANHSTIAEKFLEDAYKDDKNEFNSLHLIFILVPDLIKIEKTRELEAGWILANLSKNEAVKIINDWAEYLSKHQKPETLEVLIEAHPEHKKHKITFLSELPSISKKLVKTDDSKIGLSAWPEVNPRNVRDKIYYILKKKSKPMHFNDIALEIDHQKFDRKKVVRATVHNELIADSRFVLVGRGIYALKEWGFGQGTVAEIIKQVLKNKSAMNVDAIVSEVLKQRMVKRNTILINLQTKPFFKKVGKDQYSLA